MSYFEAKNINVRYSNKEILKDISFDADSKEITGILGVNGCGKTTLLKAICNVVAHSGNCFIDSKPLEKVSTKELAQLCSYIPQVSGVNIDISTLDVVLMGFNPKLKLLENPTKEMIDIAVEVLVDVGLEDKINDNYLHLSQGQKQLCIFARSIVSDCKLLLLDEPESALDFQFRYSILSKIKNWIISNGALAIVTLHDINLALNYCDKIILISEGNISDIIYPHSDTIEAIEKKLSVIYGDISVHNVDKKDGTKQLVMIKE